MQKDVLLLELLLKHEMLQLGTLIFDQKKSSSTEDQDQEEKEEEELDVKQSSPSADEDDEEDLYDNGSSSGNFGKSVYFACFPIVALLIS